MSKDESSGLVEFRIVFRDEPERVFYRATPDVLAAIAADWQLNKPARPVYQVFSRTSEPCTLMLRFDDVLYIG